MVVIALVPLLLASATYSVISARASSESELKAYAVAGDLAQESFMLIKTIKTFFSFSTEAKKYQDKIDLVTVANFNNTVKSGN